MSPFSAVTVTVTVFSPSFNSVFPSTVALALLSVGVAVTFTLVISFGTVKTYSFTSLLNSGVIAPSAIANSFNELSFDFSFSSTGLVVVGFLVGLPLFDEPPEFLSWILTVVEAETFSSFSVE